MNTELLETVKNVPLEELGEVFAVLAERVYEHRKGNNGYVPFEIFASCIGIGGIYPCVEVIPAIRRIGHDEMPSTKVCLKKREGKEQGWKDKYQIPGVAGRIGDSPKQIFDRLAEEIFGNGASSDELPFEFIGVEIHDEPERHATCWTVVFELPIRERPAGDWLTVNFGVAGIPTSKIVDHHLKTLEWFFYSRRALFVDLRS